MHNRGMWAAGLTGAMLVVMGAARTARAADEPLLVVVETEPGLDVDAADVRRRIASELGAQVVSPSDPAATRASQVLIVALDQRDIRVSMRSGTSERVSRTIPDVAERAARMRAVAWLAGNLARDQVGPLLPNLALAATPKPAAERATATGPAAPPPPIAELPAVAPPPVRAERATEADANASAHVEPDATNFHPRWWITASGGATLTDGCLQLGWHPAVTCGPTGGAASPFASGSNYQLEVLHKTTDEGTIVGAALDTGPDPHLVGLAGLIGTRRPWGRWYLEATLGAGIDAERVYVATTTVVSYSGNGTGDITVTPQVQPALYARATGSIAFPINRTFDFLARLNVHISSSGGANDFIGASAGLRLKLL